MNQNQLNQYCAQMAHAINSLSAQKDRLSQEDQNLGARMRALSKQAQVGNESPRSLEHNLKRILPAHLYPGNVGKLDAVAWPFYYSVNFDFGTNPTLSNTTRAVQGFQVTQEAAFLLLGITFNFQDQQSEAGFLGPYTLEIRDRQSSRQLNDEPIPIQTMGTNSVPTKLPTPFLVMPNANVDLIVSTWLTAADGNLVTVGESALQFSLSGLRIRIDKARNVLSTVFSKG